jgi:cytochrome c551/c552
MKTLIFLTLIFNALWANNYGQLLFHGNCITCHKIGEAVSAPSINEIQHAYKSAFRNKKDFIDYMTTWVLNPKEETSLMQDAVSKYELMPHLAYDKQTLEIIASYLYDTAF